jgi:hypothetical protein
MGSKGMGDLFMAVRYRCDIARVGTNEDGKIIIVLNDRAGSFALRSFCVSDSVRDAFLATSLAAITSHRAVDVLLESLDEYSICLAMYIVIDPRYAPTGPSADGDDMQPGEVLRVGQSLSPPSGSFRFVYQGDGNVVLYRTVDGAATWASNTAGQSVGVCIMQGDGNLVVYNAAFQPVWSSGTFDHPGSRCVVQGDGNVVVYAPDGTPLWDSGTAQPEIPSGPSADGDDMQPGEVLRVGQSLSPPSGSFRFVYQGDGNLVLYRTVDGAATWASNTAGQSVGVCIMQGDGNLVVYNAAGQAVWDAGTFDHPGSRCVVQGDGNVVVYAPDGTPLWASAS